jgi:heme oxygenase (biliverdin-producing, ferredoxin)
MSADPVPVPVPADRVPARDAPLAQHLREATHDDHVAAERTPFVTRLLAGEGSVEAHTHLVAQLYRVYAALEACAAEVEAHPHVGPFVDRRLDRVAAIEADLAAVVGPRWRQVLPPALPATTAYVERIWLAVGAWPGAYVAHHYTRYLGDLSGGQVIAAMMRRRYGMAAEELGFYAFEGVDAVAAKRAYRSRLDALPWGPAERAALVAEARTAFALNRRLFEELDEALGGEVGA